MASSLVVVTDTCAIFPQTLRDVLLRAAEAGLYRLRWSEEILDELGRNLREERGLTEDQTRHLLTEMRRAFPEATVTGYERLVGSLTNDPKDRHVLAAAVQAGAQVIVTDNLKDFPDQALAPFDIEAQTPDDFLVYLLDRYPDEVAQVVLAVNVARKKPPELLPATLDRLARLAPGFAAQVRDYLSGAPRSRRAMEEEIPPEVQEIDEDLLRQAGRSAEFLVPHPGQAGGFPPPEIVEDRLLSGARSLALPVSSFTEITPGTQPGETLHVAVIKVFLHSDFAETLRALHPARTVHVAARWRMFPSHACAFLYIDLRGARLGTFALEFAGPSRLALALAINRQGRFGTTAITPASEADVRETGVVWTFPFSPEAEASLSRMIQKSTRGTAGTT